MSFREPSVLIGLLLLPLAAMAYAVMQRRKRADAARFGNPALLPGLATARPGWRRHLPRCSCSSRSGRWWSRSRGRSGRSPRRSGRRR